MKLKLLLFSLLMPILSFSQSGYPKQILLENDSVVAVTKSQVKVLNLLKVSFDQQVQLNAENKTKIEALKTELVTTEKMVNKLQDINAINEAEIDNRQQLITAQKQNIEELNKSLRKEKVKKGFLLGAAVVVITTVLILK